MSISIQVSLSVHQNYGTTVTLLYQRQNTLFKCHPQCHYLSVILLSKPSFKSPSMLQNQENYVPVFQVRSYIPNSTLEFSGSSVIHIWKIYRKTVPIRYTKQPDTKEFLMPRKIFYRSYLTELKRVTKAQFKNIWKSLLRSSQRNIFDDSG